MSCKVPCKHRGLKFKKGPGMSQLKAKPSVAQNSNTKVEDAIVLFTKWMRGKLVYTGRTENANKCARILHIWQAFAEAHKGFLLEKFEYKALGKPGQRGSMFAMFRDEILPASLRHGHVRSDIDCTLSTIESQARHVKRVPCRTNGLPSARSVAGWELVIARDP